jgi:uncharacterized membrane protein YcjF (UPF0283 family)
MELLTTAVFMLMMVLAAVNWILASFQKDDTKKIVSTLGAIFFLLLGIILQIVG